MDRKQSKAVQKKKKSFSNISAKGKTSLPNSPLLVPPLIPPLIPPMIPPMIQPMMPP